MPAGPARGDVFDTGALRARVLAAWAASPARFREDANAEEDAALGSYRDRLVVELVQNAVDAAAPGPARVLFRLHDDPPVLEVANTGAPLTADGVQALATLRASAKRGASSVGRFGVGFAAVLAVSEEPAIVSAASSGVRWSRQDTLRLAGQVDSLADEIERRAGAVPVLRLPFPYVAGSDGPGPPPGYDTLVRLPLREPGAARALLAAIDPTLPLVAAGLSELAVEYDGERHVHTCEWDGDDATLSLDGEPIPPPSGRWLGVTVRGRVPPDLLADRPVEERVRGSYEIRTLYPQGLWPAQAPRVWRAPQPTDEPLSLPLVLTAPLPVEPSRRHTVAGPLRDFLIERAAEAVIALAERLGSSGSTAALDLVPVGLAHGEPDAYLRHAVARLLPQARVLPGGVTGAGCAVLEAGRPGRPVARPSGRSWEESYEAVRAALAGCVDVLPAAFARAGLRPALNLLGVRSVTAADAVEALAGLVRPADWWAAAYVALAAWADAEALGALPVPLADGRVVTGPREVLLPTPGLDLPALLRAGLRLRIAAPGALSGGAGDVLRLLGARDATAEVLLDHPALRDAVEAGEAGEAGGAGGAGLALANAVLPLVLEAGVRPAERDWLSALPLPDTEGQLLASGDLVLPGGGLDRVLGADAAVGRLDAAMAARWPASVLAAVGVLDTFPVVHADDVHADPHDRDLPDLAGAEDWVASLGSSGEMPATGVLHDVVAIADLDLVADDRWPEAVRELAQPPLRRVLLAPGPSYTRWWLARHALLPDEDGVLLPTPELCTSDAEPMLAGIYALVADLGVDSDVLAAAGCRRRRGDVLAAVDDVLDLLDRLGDPAREVTWRQARALYRAAARRLDRGCAASGDPAPAPLTVRTADRGVVHTRDAVIVDVPDLLPLLGQRGQLRVPVDEVAAVSRVLGVRIASGIAAFEVVSRGVRHEDLVEHDRLLVRDADGRPVPVAWRVWDGVAHVDASAGPEERGRALALAAGCWSRRAVVIAGLRAPELGRIWAAEAELDPAGALEKGGAS